MIESVNEQMETINNIYSECKLASDGLYFSKDQIVKLNKSKKQKLELNYILVAICKNGGLIALCKTKNYMKFNSSINNNIIVMHQDAINRYLIPIDWDYSKRYIVSIEFNYKEQLYAFCNDGTILKLDIVTRKAIPKKPIDALAGEKICKAKLFEKGFIVLTEEGTIYLVENIKNPIPIFIISIKEQLGFTNDIDFIGIPASKSCSGNFEIIITNQKGEGVLHIERQEAEDTRRQTFRSEVKGHKYKKVNVNVINSPKLQKYSVYQNSPEQNNKIGKVKAIAISPLNETIALYVSDSHTVFFLSTEISSKKENKIWKNTFKINDDFEEDEKIEQEKILSYELDLQLLFCGEDNAAICGGLFTMIFNKSKGSVAICVQENKNENQDFVYCRGISEVDGIRYIADEEICLISQVSKEFLGIFPNPLSKTKKPKELLLEAYGYYLSKKPNGDELMRKIGDDLPKYTYELLSAAGDIYWIEKDPQTYNKRDTQMFLVKASQFCKNYLKRQNFNFLKFVELCNSIRIINNMRNFPLKPRYITYREFECMDFEEIINITMRQLNFKLASQICKFMNYSDSKVYLKYAITKIKKGDVSEYELYDEVMKILKKVENISYIEIAKICLKYQKENLAEKFLSMEKSDLVRIPKYVELKKWDKVLELSLKSYDNNLLYTIVDKMYKVESINNFTHILSNFPQVHKVVIDYFKRMEKKPKDLDTYFRKILTKDELFFIELEKFFESEILEERRKSLNKAKQFLKEAKNIDINFYNIYISDLENSLKFKEDCLKKELIGKDVTNAFDNSIYDCFQKSTPESLPWVDAQNSQHFGISKRKMTILRLSILAKNKKFDEIDNIIQKETFKKLEINPLKVASIMYENENEEKALEYAKKETNTNFYEDKFKFLMNMGKYLDAVEAALSEKKNEKKMEFIYKVLEKKPELRNEIEELCEKYKIRL